MNRGILVGVALVTSVVASTAVGQDADSFKKSMNEDLQMAGVVHVVESGDIDLFGGSVIVPARRPSIERCGVHMAQSSQARADALRRVVSEARDHAVKRGFSARERHEYTKKATLPLNECQRKFKRRCEEVRAEVPVEVRQKAIAVAQKEIDRLAKGPSEKAVIKSYLAHVVEACPLAE